MSRKIDALIAEHVFGCKVDLISIPRFMDEPCGDYVCNCEGVLFEHKLAPFGQIRHFSTNISDAWEVVEKMEGYSFRLDRHLYDGTCWAYFNLNNKEPHEASYECEFTSEENSAPLAICLAALKAKGISVDDN